MAKILGSALEGTVRFLAHHRDAAERLLAPAIHHYLDARISPNAWYPEADLVAMIRAMLRLVPGSRDDLLEEMGRGTLHSHREGPHTGLIEGEGLSDLAGRIPKLWTDMHDTGALKLAESGPGRLRVELSDHGHPSSEICRISRAYLQEALRVNGIVAESREIACAAEGDGTCVWEFAWTAAGADDAAR